MSGALILTGAPGSGKSSVLDALCTLLEVDRLPFGAIETEELARGWPWLSSRQWLPHLQALLELQREAGRHTFLVVATTENEQELRALADAVAAEATLVVCLSASPQVVAQRVAEREPDSWPGKPALVEHAGELARVIPSIPGLDIVLSTAGRSAAGVAAEIYELLIESGIVDEPSAPGSGRPDDSEVAADRLSADHDGRS